MTACSSDSSSNSDSSKNSYRANNSDNEREKEKILGKKTKKRTKLVLCEERRSEESM